MWAEQEGVMAAAQFGVSAIDASAQSPANSARSGSGDDGGDDGDNDGSDDRSGGGSEGGSEDGSDHGDNAGQDAQQVYVECTVQDAGVDEVALYAEATLRLPAQALNPGWSLSSEHAINALVLDHLPFSILTLLGHTEARESLCDWMLDAVDALLNGHLHEFAGATIYFPSLCIYTQSGDVQLFRMSPMGLRISAEQLRRPSD